MSPVTKKTRNTLLMLAVLAILGTLSGVAFFMHGRMERELEDLPPAERQGLYVRTLETLQTTCSRASGPSLSEYCQEQASFVLRFPECDHECHALAERFVAGPTR